MPVHIEMRIVRLPPRLDQRGRVFDEGDADLVRPGFEIGVGPCLRFGKNGWLPSTRLQP